MADGKAIKTLRKIAEGEHLAANALAVAASKAKELDVQKFLGELSSKHELNATTAGSKLKELGGKYPVPGLRDTLKQGWESVATSKTSTDALKLLQKKERDAVSGYKSLMNKAKDEELVGYLARNLADTTDSLTALGDKLKQMQGKKEKNGRFLGLPRLIWLAALGAGAVVLVQRVRSGGPQNPTTPSDNGNKS